MSLIVLGLSHHGAPLDLLEASALDSDGAVHLEAEVLASEHIVEALVLSTCNRTEIYAQAGTFHGALTDLSRTLSSSTGRSLEQLQPHLYVHYEERCIAHTFRVAAGLDSMAVGEAQVLGQLRAALVRAQNAGHVGSALNVLIQQALRVGKRVHSETDIDLVSHSLVDAGLQMATGRLGPLAGLSTLIVGAGGMGALAATTAQRAGVGGLTIVNRGVDRAERLAERLGARSRPFSDGVDALADSDIVISSTGARGRVIRTEDVAQAMAARDGRPQVYLDLAVPHDIDLEVAELPGVTRIGLDALATVLSTTGELPPVKQAGELVTGEVAAYLTARSADLVAPTVTALRERANRVVQDELERLDRRAPHLGQEHRSEVERTLRRTVDKLLHTPTVRVKQLAQTGQGGDYTRALDELFDLDPRDISVVSTPADIPHIQTLGGER